MPTLTDAAALTAISLISDSGRDLDELLGEPLEALTHVADQLARAEPPGPISYADATPLS